MEHQTEAKLRRYKVKIVKMSWHEQYFKYIDKQFNEYKWFFLKNRL